MVRFLRREFTSRGVGNQLLDQGDGPSSDLIQLTQHNGSVLPHPQHKTGNWPIPTIGEKGAHHKEFGDQLHSIIRRELGGSISSRNKTTPTDSRHLGDGQPHHDILSATIDYVLGTFNTQEHGKPNNTKPRKHSRCNKHLHSIPQDD